MDPIADGPLMDAGPFAALGDAAARAVLDFADSDGAIARTCGRWRAAARRRPWPRALVATTPDQLRSLAERPRTRRFASYEACDLENRAPYFAASCRPITVRAEDDMELLSDLVTWGERFLHVFDRGAFFCARCRARLLRSEDKWAGPCVWPSWRRAIPGAVHARRVDEYGAYACRVDELYCADCDLFLGHRFEDAADKGDRHADARWRL